VIVSDIEVTSSQDYCELRAQIQSHAARKPFLLRFCLPPAMKEFLDPENGDPFLAAVLLPAMRANETVDIPVAVSPKLLHAVGQIQSLYRSWDKGLSQVGVKAAARKDRTTRPGRPLWKGLFFSCGVDSYYSLFRNFADRAKDEDAITHLIVLQGFDIPFGTRDPSIFRRILSNARTVSNQLQIRVIPVATNVRDFGIQFADWAGLYHGAALASVGLTLGNVFETIRIAASFSPDQLFPWGTHPALDRLWSTESLSFSHDGGEVRRVDKIRYIARFQIVTDTLRTCTYRPFSEHLYNCGVCEKCQRTVVALHMAGALQKCTTLPNSIDLRLLRSIHVQKDLRVYVEELITGLGSSRTDLAIRSALQEALSKSSRQRPTPITSSPLLRLAGHISPALRMWVWLWRALKRSPPSPVLGLPKLRR
jgi:hypothetical protein